MKSMNDHKEALLIIILVCYPFALLFCGIIELVDALIALAYVLFCLVLFSLFMLCENEKECEKDENCKIWN